MVICIFHKKEINEELKACDTCLEWAFFNSIDDFTVPHIDGVAIEDLLNIQETEYAED